VEEELLTESRRLLRDGLPQTVPRRLDEAHRFIPLSLATDGDVAAIAFLRRLPAGHSGIETWILQRRGQWCPLGGGATTLRAYPLTDRLAAAEQGGYLGQLSSGFVTRKPAGRFPWGSRRVFHAQFRAAAEVDKLQTGNRLLTVPFHGYTVIVWRGRRAPAVTAVAADGSQLASLNPNLDHFRLRTRLRRRLRWPGPRRQLAPGVARYGPGLRSRPR
jgi:hypothetical protein